LVQSFQKNRNNTGAHKDDQVCYVHNTAPEYDGVAEVWFESEEELMTGMSSPEGQSLGAALLEDEGNFIDHSKSCAFLVQEYEL